MASASERLPPLSARAVLVIRHHVVVVHVETCENRAPTGTADRRRDESVRELDASLPHDPQRFRHELHRAELDVLIIGDQKEDVWTSAGAETNRLHLREYGTDST